MTDQVLAPAEVLRARLLEHAKWHDHHGAMRSAELLREAAAALLAAGEEAETPLSAEVERELRIHLWLSHGHWGQYGDDGEMQCGECMPFGMWDYKREPLEKVVLTAIEARRNVNLKALQAASLSPAVPPQETPLNHGDVRDWKTAALIFGESLASIGPTGYYAFTPQQWLEWARATATPSPAPPETLQQSKLNRIREVIADNNCDYGGACKLTYLAEILAEDEPDSTATPD